ncbi:hypothetical protein CYMTET_46826 [Cymbomonas tetramitiformis]|uniref:Phytanoyl-CoA dioxygenase n=1 Tax=Cymbomonas tetramitiformis TaxID=36881 RepID=A0AAE0BWL7_9CHLO|nr:hypothetical protein CYMTET_46826 [Cymbomonas tetramitiformis]
MKQLATKFREQGFLSPVRVLSPDQARTLRADLEAYECDHSLRGNKRFKLHLLTRWAAQLVRHPRILEVVQAILGPDILVWSSDVNIKGPSSDSFFSWHQATMHERAIAVLIRAEGHAHKPSMMR